MIKLSNGTFIFKIGKLFAVAYGEELAKNFIWYGKLHAKFESAYEQAFSK